MTILSDLLGAAEERGAVTHMITSDITIDSADGNIHVLKPDAGGYFVTPNTPSMVSTLVLINDSDFNIKIKVKADGTYVTIPAGEVSEFFYGNNNWYVIEKTGRELSKDIDGNNLSSNEFVFNTGTTYYTSVSMLDSTHFVVAYADQGNNNYGTAIIGTVSGTSVSFGSEYVFNVSNTVFISVSMLDSTHFVVAYRDDGNNYYGTAIIGTVSGNSISFGSEYVFNTQSTYYTSVAMLDSTHFVVTYTDVENSNRGTAIIGTVSGTSVSFGSEYVFNAGQTSYISVATIDSTHFIVAYEDAGNSQYGTAIIGTVSGNSISFGSEYVFNAEVTGYISVAMLDSTHFVVAYRDNGNFHRGTAIIGTVSGNSISFSSEYVFNAGTTNYTSAAMLDSTHFVIVYDDYGNNDYGTAIIGTVSGSSVSFGNESVFNLAHTEYISVATINSNHFVVAYQDIGNNYYGTVALVEG